MAISAKEKKLIELTGEFLVAGKLCARGYLAALTVKDYPEVDIFVLNPRNDKRTAVQVKSKRHGGSYFIPEKINEMTNPFVFVYINNEDSFDYYIASAEQVAEISERQRQEYLDSRPNVSRKQPRMIPRKSLEPFKDRGDLLELD